LYQSADREKVQDCAAFSKLGLEALLLPCIRSAFLDGIAEIAEISHDPLGQEGKAFPSCRAKVSADPFCGGTPQRPLKVRVQAKFSVTG
jgi:hypothetical protein